MYWPFKTENIRLQWLFEQERIIDELEGSLTGAPIDATNTEVPVVAVEENFDEDITVGANVSKVNESSDDMGIDLEEEQNT